MELCIATLSHGAVHCCRRAQKMMLSCSNQILIRKEKEELADRTSGEVEL